jgi:UDP-glucose 4-epimerase
MPFQPFARLRVLVTGGAGFIGSHLVEALLARGARVCVLDDLSTGSRANLPRHPRLSFARGCVTDPAAMGAVRGADLVFHLAGIVGVRLAARDRERAFRVAEDGTRNLIEASGAARLVLFSSSAVYGHAGAAPVAEEGTAPEDALLDFDGGIPGYASGKWRLEELGRAAAAAGREVLLIRPFNVVGPRQTGQYGMVVPRLVDSALHHRPLTVFDQGAQSRCFSEVRSFTRAVVEIADRPRSWAVSGRAVNVGAARPTAIGDLARIVLEETGSASPIEHVPYDRVFPGHRDVAARVPDTTRCRSLIGEVDWPGPRAIVREVVRWAVRGLAQPAAAPVPVPVPVA